MNARQKVIAGLGGKCSWCGSTSRVLEIDHIDGGQGQGNAHRKAIGKKLEYWLCDQYAASGHWPPGYQLLCTTPERTGCHDLKSGRRPMPSDKDLKRFNVGFPEAKLAHLEQLATGPPYDGSKSKLLEAAFDRFLETQAEGLAMQGIQQQLSSLQATLLAAVQTPAPPPAGVALDKRLVDLSERLATMNTRLAGVDNELARVHSRLSGLLTPAPVPVPRSWWRTLLRTLLRTA